MPDSYTPQPIKFLPTFITLTSASVVSVGTLVLSQKVPVLKDVVQGLQRGVHASLQMIGGPNRDWTKQTNAAVDDIATLATVGAITLILGRIPGLAKPIDAASDKIADKMQKLGAELFGLDRGRA